VAGRRTNAGLFTVPVELTVRTLPRTTAALIAWLCAGLPATHAAAADQFAYTMRREVHAMDLRTGGEVPFASEKVGADTHRTLGVTGRVAIARRMTLVEDGGQVFVYAMLPEALASSERDLDVLIDGKDGMKVRGSIHFTPGGSRRVARLFVLPDLVPGPALVEVHVRGVHVAEWQEIVTEEIDVPAKGRLHFGYTLEGSTGKSPPVELVVEARPAKNEKGMQPVTLLSTSVSGGRSGKWEDETKDLGRLAGHRIQLAFRSRPAGDAAAGAPGIVWGAPAIEVDEKRRAYPLILVVSLDSLRASEVGLYSGRTTAPSLGSLFGKKSAVGDATPFLDDFFGSRGAVMTHALTQSVTTLPSHFTLMTGLSPMSHGVVDETHTLGPGVATLAQVLRESGWHTAAFTEGGALAGELGFRRGFDLYDEGSSTEIEPSTSDAIERAKHWLEDYSGIPLFVFVHTYATRPVHGGVDGTADPKIRKDQLAAYAEQVHRADAALKGLFESLDGRIDEDHALYVVTSGHGEAFFEHGAVGHGTELYDEAVRVPLMLRGTAIEETGKQSLLVGLVDVAPTILELAGVRAPAGMQGRSFAPLLEAGRSVLAAPRFSEARRPVRLTDKGQLMLWGPPSYAMCDGTRKLIWNAGAGDTYEAFDLARDPDEQRNLVTVSFSPEWATRMAATLRNYPATAARHARPGGKANLSPANRSRLESLGYAR